MVLWPLYFSSQSFDTFTLLIEHVGEVTIFSRFRFTDLTMYLASAAVFLVNLLDVWLLHQWHLTFPGDYQMALSSFQNSDEIKKI